MILTGGDPLVASPRRLRETMRALAAIDHVKVAARAHARAGRGAGDGHGRAGARRLKVTGKPTYVAVHVNHPRELAREQRAAIARLADAGLPLVSQTVLLKGVNDDVETLEALMRALVECRIKPYYLHHADLAPGTAHLRTDIADGQALMRRCAAASPVCASRTTCSTFPAATANRRSGRAISSARARTAARMSRSRTSAAGAIAIRPNRSGLQSIASQSLRGQFVPRSWHALSGLRTT